MSGTGGSMERWQVGGPREVAGRRFGREAVVAWLLLWLATAVMVVSHARMPGVPGLGGTFSYLDYRDTVWVPMRDFLAGNNPWHIEGYLRRHPTSQSFPLYTPSFWWVAIPLSLLPYRVSVAVWAAVGCASLVWLCSWGVPLAHRGLRRVVELLGLVFLALMARPVRSALFQGQWALPCAAAAVMALTLPRHKVRAGAAALTVALVKPQVGLLVLVACLLTRRRRQAAWAVVWSAVLAVPFLAVLAFRDGWTQLLSSVRESMRFGTGADQAHGAALNGRVDLFELPYHLGLSPSGALLAVVALAVAVVLLFAWRRASGPVGTDGQAGGAALLVGGSLALVVLPNMLYGAVVLLPGALLLVRETFDRTRSLRHRGAGLVALLLLVPPFFVSSSMARLLGLTPQQDNFINGFGLLLAAVWSSVLCLAGEASGRVRAEGATTPPGPGTSRSGRA